MAERRAFILLTVVGGATCILLGTPHEQRWYVAGASLFLLAYIYAELTRPRGGGQP